MSTANVSPAAVTVSPAADDAATFGHEEREILARSTRKNVKLSECYSDGNYRDESDFDIATIVRSIRERGFLPQFAIVVVELENGSGQKYLILQGNQRFAAAAECELKTLPAVILPAGLSAEQIAMMRVDVTGELDRKKVNKWTEFLAVRTLVRANYASQAGIARKLGQYTVKDDKLIPNRSWIQPRVYLARLPEWIQAEFRKVLLKTEDAMPLKFNTQCLNDLKNAQQKDIDAGDFSGSGAALSAEFAKQSTPPAADAAAADAAAVVCRSVKDITDAVGTFGADTIIGQALLWCLNSPHVPNLEPQSRRELRAAADAALLARVRKHSPEVLKTLPEDK